MTGGLDEALAALADPLRRRLLEDVVRNGGTTATVLSRSVPVTRQAVVKHLQVLADAGLVVPVRRGREVCYEPVDGGLDSVGAWVTATSEAWDGRLARFRARALAPETPSRRIDVDSTGRGT